MSAKSATHRVSDIVSMAHVEYLLGIEQAKLIKLSHEAPRHYDPFDRRREAGLGKWRHIDNPKGPLRKAQRNIQRRFLARVPLPENMFGGVKGRSIRDNGRLHARKSMVVTLDLKSCFPNISDVDVFKVFHDRLGCRGKIPGLLTRLTTFHHRLPQGAPTSTMLANLALLPLYEALNQIAAAHNLSMSFWVDDIAISGERADAALDEVIAEIQSHGHQISCKKLLIMPRNSAPQRVTGLTVNRGVSVGHKKIQSIYHEIHELASESSIPDFRICRVYGLIQHVEQMKLPQGRRLRRLAEDLLPKRGTNAKRPRTDEIRRCRNAKRHRPSRGTATPIQFAAH
jgi:RNA-directed DNA polymerase